MQKETFREWKFALIFYVPIAVSVVTTGKCILAYLDIPSTAYFNFCCRDKLHILQISTACNI